MNAGSEIQAILEGSPYATPPSGAWAVAQALASLAERIATLRSTGCLTEATLRRYYGDRRFEHVAESNAIEGSTLSVGETELAILKGTTLTGHDPGFVRDAIALDRALARLTELARSGVPTDIPQVKELHEIILEGRVSAGAFRTTPVRISGSEHRPPKTWEAVMRGMEQWEVWSRSHAAAPPLLRAAVLHAWFVHVHPFVDGNGRTARAISNLELIRHGHPPIVIRKVQDRIRYIDALEESDAGGNIGPFLDLILDRGTDALVGLELAARKGPGYSPAVAKLRQAQGRRLPVWNAAVEFLYRVLVERLTERLEASGGNLKSRLIAQSLGLDEYVELCAGRPVSRSWAFVIEATAPGFGSTERLAWVGFRSEQLRRTGNLPDFAPSIFWSQPNSEQFPPWMAVSPPEAPGVVEFSLDAAAGDRWHALDPAGGYRNLLTSELAAVISAGFVLRLSSQHDQHRPDEER